MAQCILRRHYAPDTAGMPGMDLGTLTVGATGSAGAARDAYEGGARHALLPQTIDLDGPDHADTVAALVLVRDLTSYGIVVDWRLAHTGAGATWRQLAHLHPPRELLAPDGADALSTWRASHCVGKCFFRNGPGFVQVRDWRTGQLRRITINEPRHRAAITQLLEGARAREVDQEVLADYTAAGLVDTLGAHAWWMPYRVRRWPQSHTAV
ncbi:DUF5825 family protein [Streptomyces sp. NPDC053474]|uniref:DUF5825 family protein n=1 Tax=Streptomyces sp. NPDC053474 TaxID=3365704 RepID=UPI0037D8D3FC